MKHSQVKLNEVNIIAQDMSMIFRPLQDISAEPQEEGNLDYHFGNSLSDSRRVLKLLSNSLNSLFSEWVTKIWELIGSNFLITFNDIANKCQLLVLENFPSLTDNPHLKGTITYLVTEYLRNIKIEELDNATLAENIFDQQIIPLINFLNIKSDIAVPEDIQEKLQQKGKHWIKDEQIYQIAIDEFKKTNNYGAEVKLYDVNNIKYSLPIIKCLVLTEKAQPFKDRLETENICDFISKFKDGIGRNVLHYAIWKDRTDIIDILCEKIPSLINGVDEYGRTPLHTVCNRGGSHLIEKLYGYGALITKDTYGRTPLHLAASSYIDAVEKIEKLVKLFHDLDVNVKDTWNRAPIHLAAVANNVDSLKKLLFFQAEVNILDKYKFTPAHLAAKRDNFESVRALQFYGANLTLYDCNGSSPIHLAAKWASIKTLEFLCRSPKVGMYFKDKIYGSTPLHTAVFFGSSNAVKTLLHLGANPHIRDKKDLTVLDQLVKQKHPFDKKINQEAQINIISQFIDHGYRFPIKEKELPKYKPIQDYEQYMLKGNKLLQDKSIDESTLKNGLTLSYLILKRGWDEIGRDLKITKEKQERLKQEAIKVILDYLDTSCVKDIIDILINNPSIYKISKEDLECNFKNTFIESTASLLRKDDKEGFKILIDKGKLTVNAQDELGNSPIIYATKYHSYKIIELLLAYNASPFSTNKFGDSAFSIAVENRNTQLVKDFLLPKKHEITKAGLKQILSIEDDREFYYDLAQMLSIKDTNLTKILGLTFRAEKTCFLKAIEVCDFLAKDTSDLLGASDLIFNYDTEEQ